MANKLCIALLYGGRSGEHEVSLRSAEAVAAALAPRHQVVPVLIEPGGNFLLQENGRIATSGGRGVIIRAAPGDAGALRDEASGQILARPALYFPVLHGPFGEDGTVQGLLEMAGVAYAGSGVAASAAGMDKVLMKGLFASAGLPQTPYRTLRSTERADVTRRIAGLTFPLFVKPANLGSSVGVHLVESPAEVEAAIDDAFRYDRKVLVEEGVRGVRELEVAVLGNDDALATQPGEVIPDRAFYDYDSKYSATSQTRVSIPAAVEPSMAAEARRLALAAFEALDAAGFARVDLFLDSTGRLLLNEINTIPGFTSISMFPKLWQAEGVSFADLVDRIVALAIARHGERQALRTSR